MNAQVLMVDLKDAPAVVETYLEHHRRAWPEVLRSLKAAGVLTLDIYILDRRLVMIVDTGDRDPHACLAAHAASGPRVAEWETLMREMQQPSPGTPPGEWWAAMRPVFSLDGFTGSTVRPEPAHRV